MRGRPWCCDDSFFPRLLLFLLAALPEDDLFGEEPFLVDVDFGLELVLDAVATVAVFTN